MQIIQAIKNLCHALEREGIKAPKAIQLQPGDFARLEHAVLTTIGPDVPQAAVGDLVICGIRFFEATTKDSPNRIAGYERHPECRRDHGNDGKYAVCGECAALRRRDAFQAQKHIADKAGIA